MLVFDGIIYSLQANGGISVYFNELLRRMGSGGAEHRLLVGLGSHAPAGFLRANACYFKSRPVERYRRCQIPAGSSLFHSSYYRLPDHGVPVVTTVHDFIYEHFSGGLRRWVHSWQKFSAIRASQAVICVSESTRRDLLNFLPEIRPERVHVVHNGVGEAFFPLESGAMKLLRRRPYVLYVGARGGYKNFEALVRAMTLLPDLDLVCVGGGKLTSADGALVQSALGGRFVHYLGVSDKQLNEFYNQAFCLAYPSAYEGFGIPVLEAMRAGCPVVAVNASSIPEVAGDAAYLVAEGSPLDLRDALLALDRGDARAHYRAAGLERATTFSWDRTYTETCSVYDEARGR